VVVMPRLILDFPSFAMRRPGVRIPPEIETQGDSGAKRSLSQEQTGWLMPYPNISAHCLLRPSRSFLANIGLDPVKTAQIRLLPPAKIQEIL